SPQAAHLACPSATLMSVDPQSTQISPRSIASRRRSDCLFHTSRMTKPRAASTERAMNLNDMVGLYHGEPRRVSGLDRARGAAGGGPRHAALVRVGAVGTEADGHAPS